MDAAQLHAKAVELSHLIPLRGGSIQWARNPHYDDHLVYTICQKGVIDLDDARRLFNSQPNWSRSRTCESAVLTAATEATFVSGGMVKIKIIESVKRRIKTITAKYRAIVDSTWRVNGRWSSFLSRERTANLWFACLYDLLQDHVEFTVSKKIPGAVRQRMRGQYGDAREQEEEREDGDLDEREMIQATMTAELEDDVRQDQAQARRAMAELRRAVEDIDQDRGRVDRLQHHRARDGQVEQGRAPPRAPTPPPPASVQAPRHAHIPADYVAPNGDAAIAAEPVVNLDAVRNPAPAPAHLVDTDDDEPIEQDQGWIQCGICQIMLPDDGGSMAVHLSTCLGTTEGATMGSCPICDEEFASSMSTLAREQHVQACCDGGPALKGLSREHAVFAATSETIPRDPASKQIQECTICLEDFELGEELARLSCYCVMHSTCIKEYWLRPGMFCPTHRDDQPGQKVG
ncbi:BQ2448_300 [Microbotryum intermedium]|uniref:RING-type E3 ubiquitin transferase n=1 Tax=Microbotryum intermedium TaxID=269621 RepID=A0A238F5Y5_9BASI|nr:BQ2448_300 [Microbotryum intermedium]